MQTQQLHPQQPRFSMTHRLLGHRYKHVVLAGMVWLGLAACTSVYAQTNAEDGNQARWSYQLGSDAWHISASTETDSNLGLVDERSSLLLPDTKTKWDFKKLSAYGWLIGHKPITRDTTFTFKVQANQTFGLRVDEAQIEHLISPYLGFRLGVVDYKTSWCRTYESNSIWIRDVEPICNFQDFRDVTGGAPGAQVFIQNTWGAYLVQAQAGIYRPLLLNYAPQEFGYFVPAPSPEDPYIVQSNKKAGININVLNLDTAVEARVSFIKGTHQAFTPDADKLGTVKQSSDAIYAAVLFPITQTVSGRVTRFQQSQDATCLSEVARIGACNLNYNYKKAFNSVEITSAISSKDAIGIGLSESTYNYIASVFLSYDFYFKDKSRETKIKQINLAWRHDWTGGIFTNVQLIKAIHATDLTSSAISTHTPSHGYAIGMRLGYQY